VISIKKLKYIVILPLILAGCGVSVRLYQKIASDPSPTVDKLAILAPFVAENYPVRETFIVGKSDTTIVHDTTLTTAIIYDTIAKRYDSIIIKNIVSNRLIMRIDTIKVKETVDCYEINNRLLSSELKVKDYKSKELNYRYFVIVLILLLFLIIWLKFKKW
jgi:hypothetical protein